MRYFDHSMDRQEMKDLWEHCREKMQKIVEDNPMTFCFMSLLFIITWIMILFT